MVSTHEDLYIWIKAKELTIAIYAELRPCRDYSFKDQIQHASVSVMNNIAEGYGRQGKRSFRNFLLIARGSAAETQSMLYLARDLGYVTEETSLTLNVHSRQLMSMLTNFIKTIEA